MVVVDDLPQIPTELVARARRWTELKRWERRELGQALRRLGLSYKEITGFIPVSEGTLSLWCRDIALTEMQRERLRAKRPALAIRQAIGAKAREAARERHHQWREAARAQTVTLAEDALFIAGVVAYWAEGCKRSRDVCFSNSDPFLVRLFINWSVRFLERTPSEFSIRLHLHAGQDEHLQKSFWARATGVPISRFGKTFIKAEGSGHRKNVLYHGTVQVRLAKSGQDLERVMGWIQGVGDLYGMRLI